MAVLPPCKPTGAGLAASLVLSSRCLFGQRQRRLSFTRTLVWHRHFDRYDRRSPPWFPSWTSRRALAVELYRLAGRDQWIVASSR
jgi:hypothetical protein